MEVALSLRNFSYYTTSEQIYFQGTVFKIIQTQEKEENDCLHFRDIKIGSKLHFRYSSSDQSKLALLLKERIIKVETKEVLKPIDTSRCVTFIASDIKPCEI